jgi:hypothetical protein
MVSEYEMPIRPVGQSTTDLETDKSDKSTKSQSNNENDVQLQASAERGLSVVSNDGKTRSKWRLITIVTALFVREHSLVRNSRQLICLQLSLFVAALDATIVATAAPTISRDLNSAAGYTWIGAAFLLANAAAGPIWAKLSDIWGRKMIVLAALAVFFASSAVCATAKTMEALIVGRSFQGAASGGLILLVHVCISDLFSLR